MPVHTYYHRGGVQVTSHELVVRGQHYRLDHLRDVRIARGSGSRATTVCVTLACLFLVLGSCSWRVTDQAVGTSLAIITAGTLGLVAALISRRVRPRPYELWAEYQHHTVQLLWSRDERVFNQIRFALCRALQAGH
ncbi:MAG: DUF6232 family protein [Actinocatenispora sp.]